MADNVIIFGAGSSYDAGIPLMDGFLEKIRYFAFKSLSNNLPLSEIDVDIFKKAMVVMNELDGYHARASFNDRNLEDVLSILAFNILGGKSYTNVKFTNLIEAISRTIELTCHVKHNGRLDIPQESEVTIYKAFWRGLFENYKKVNSLPVIITLNYDLVLERSLLHTLVSIDYDDWPFDGVIVDYSFTGLRKFAFKITHPTYSIHEYDSLSHKNGNAVIFCAESELKNPILIKILKMHGSLNFPNPPFAKINLPETLINSIENPLIIPPISNKQLKPETQRIWKEALNQISDCKNLYIVGYSLPKTDVYFQYFLKAALGPNHDFERMYIFNPALFEEEIHFGIRERYEECFPEQLRSRIVYQPKSSGSGTYEPGTFKHFVTEIRNNDSFFY